MAEAAVEAERFAGARTLLVSLGAAALGFVGLGIGWTVQPRATLFAYLTAFTCVTALALGSLIFLMTGYVVRASWSIVLRRLNESTVSVFPLLALLFLPIGFGSAELYSWVEPTQAFSGHELELLRHKQPYLNLGFFWARAALYFVCWALVAYLLRRWSLAADRAPTRQPNADDEDELHKKQRILSALGLPLVALTLSFASFDWLMSLQPLWFSTMFGVYYFAGGFVASFGLLAMLSFAARRLPKSGQAIRPPHFHALGRLMFGFTVFWAYTAFFQAMLIQIADKPEEVSFYTQRLSNGWGVVAGLLGILRFALPFALLLSRSIKFRPKVMAAVGGLLLAGQYLDTLWLVAPAQPGQVASVDVWDLAALLAVAGSCVAFAAWRLRGEPLLPVGDPKLPRSIEYRSPL